ncbi:MAG: hypothetical protein Kow00106_26260 [Anaerolineae bacterium]
MNNYRRVLTGVTGSVIAIACALLLVSGVSADSAAGTGSIVAEGDGWVWLHGNGQVRISGQGTLVIVDRAGDATITIEHSGDTPRSAAPERDGGGRVVFRHFDGTATVSGTNVIVTMWGRNLHLEAKGTGVVRLRGHGWYQINGSPGDWNLRGPEMQFGTADPSAASATSQG